jgi:hypothetical protein
MRSDSGLFPDTEPALIEVQGRPLPPVQGQMANRNPVPSVPDLNLAVSNPPTQGEVQAIANKIDELLFFMRQAGHLSQ